MLGSLRNLFSSQPTLNDAIPLTILKLEQAMVNLKNITENLHREDNALFEKCIESRMRRDPIHAMMYANECAEIRKLAKIILSSQYALEQMVLRLHTVKKLNNILVTINPVVGVLNETRSRLVGIIPSVASNLNDANRMLVKSLNEMGTSTTSHVEPISYSAEAKKVLEEASLAAETSIRERFPEIPVDVTTVKRLKNPVAVKEVPL